VAAEPLVTAPPIETRFRPRWALDLGLTLGPLRHGPGDPTIRLEPGTAWRATRTPLGPATLHLRRGRDGVHALAWGPGATAALEGLPRLLGADDEPAALVVSSRGLRDLVARMAGLRFGRTDAVLQALVPAITEQKVTRTEARRGWRGLVLRYGERAPGPGGLWLAPSAERLASVPYHELHPLGIEQRRAATIRRVAERGAWLEAAGRLPRAEAIARLTAVPGVGAWTAAETARAAFGDPDAVSVGDFHVPSLVCWALAGERRGDDGRMLELLEPYRGQRGRLVRLMEASGMRAPRYGPRLSPRDIRGL
jgi:3-methyladenine DNA glycosylase/8-oxoguanine DNA glycosylase